MSAPAPNPTYVFDQKLDHILIVLLGLDLTGPGNLHLEMFWYKAVTTFYQFEVLCPRNFSNWTYIIPGGAITN